MKNSQASESPDNTDNDLLSEYDFDYRKARPNRFATQTDKAAVTVILDPDIAEVFQTSEAVNNALRALLSTIPKTVK
ncbi:hypothetical protein H6F74_09510 [Trichocoleus sp. FACHB-90]|uniref:hypothetical protein n=1 Tax=Cyanophyceae TaxID=3028117 RepID=UPI00168232FD|nr:hypothetical protein [Trichocoleus sp. FACHB-90]MBD1926480.1 hypothetical protein [Trichocoleus sp. FACHB-90]